MNRLLKTGFAAKGGISLFTESQLTPVTCERVPARAQGENGPLVVLP
jgi:hypothetical protein